MRFVHLLKKIARKLKNHLPLHELSGLSYPDLKLPDHETEKTIYDYLSSFSVEHAPKQEMINYLEGDYRRFLYTLSLIPAGTGRVMEIGANPYYMSMLIRKYTHYELHCSNYFGDGLQREGMQYMVSSNNDKIGFHFKHFNVEVEVIPY